jgi:hypothetical protein
VEVGHGPRIYLDHVGRYRYRHWSARVSTNTYFLTRFLIQLCRSYNINGSSSVLPVGVLDAVSAGILLYIGIHLLMQDVGRPTSLDMSADPSLQWIYGQLAQGKTLHIAVALAALILGLFCMSLLGKWA